MATQNAQTPSKDEGKQEASTKEATKTKQPQVDEAAKQTFPASDSPAGWAGKDIAPQDREDAQKKG